MFGSVNPIGVLIAGLSQMPLGMAWYGPLFGKEWTKLMNFSEKSMAESKKNMGPTYATQMVASLLQAFVLSLIADATQADTTMQFILLGFWIWLGFTATVQLTGKLFSGKPFNLKLYAIDTGYQLTVMLMMAIILSLF